MNTNTIAWLPKLGLRKKIHWKLGVVCMKFTASHTACRLVYTNIGGSTLCAMRQTLEKDPLLFKLHLLWKVGRGKI